MPVAGSHDAGPQVTSLDARPAQVSRFVPSHAAWEQGSLAVPVLHGTRGGCGVPVIGTQVPTEPMATHASHCPRQSSLQQTPSTQKPLWQSPAAVHGPPFGFLVSHFPALQ